MIKEMYVVYRLNSDHPDFANAFIVKQYCYRNGNEFVEYPDFQLVSKIFPVIQTMLESIELQRLHTDRIFPQVIAVFILKSDSFKDPFTLLNTFETWLANKKKETLTN